MTDISGTTEVPSTAPDTSVVTDTPPSGSTDVTSVSADVAPTQEPSFGPGDDGLYEIQTPEGPQRVTLEELHKGYLRQSDYTRKTQAVAERAKSLDQAEALAAAFDRDPDAAISALVDAYGWTPQQAAAVGQAAQQEVAQGQWDDPQEVDPLEARLQAVEARFAQQQRDSINQAIERDYQSLEQQFGTIDREAVRLHAIKKGTDLITAYRDMTFDSVAANRKALEDKVAAQDVHGGSSAQPGTVQAPPAQGTLRDTIRAAVEAAKGK